MNTPTTSTTLIPCIEPADDLEHHTCACGWRGARDQMQHSDKHDAEMCPDCWCQGWRF